MIQDGLDHEAVVKQVVGWYDDWKQARADKETIWQECLTNYLVVIDEKKYENWPWRCQVADTFSQETADTISSALRNALFPVNEEYFEVQGVDLRGRDFAPVMDRHMKDQLHRLRFVERLVPWAKQLAVIGNAPLLLSWDTQEETRRRRVVERNLKTNERKVVTRDERRKTYDGPSVTVLDSFDVVFSPGVMAFAQTPFIRRTKVCRDQLPTLYKGVDFSDLDEPKAKLPMEVSDLHKVARAKVFGVDIPETSPSQKSVEDEVEVLELHGTCVLDGERHEDVVIAIVNRTILARFERNPYWAGRQIVWSTYDDLWFTPFGKGPLEPVRGTQQLIDTFSCQKADILNLIINGCFAYIDDGIIDPETLFLRPRGGIEVGNLANIKELHPNQNVALTYQEIETLRARGERSTGSSRFDMGQAPGGRRTAFEASLIKQGSSGRAIDVTKHLANDVLEYVLEFFLLSNQQFLWDTNTLPNEVLLGEYRINYLGADLSASRQFEMQQALLFLDLVGRYKTLGDAANMRELFIEIARLFNFKNPDIVKSKAQYLREYAQQQAQAEAEQMAAQSAAMGQVPGPPQPVLADQAAVLGGMME